MNDEKVKEAELGNSILAILGGVAAIFLAGLILYPLMQIISEKFWDFDLFGEKKGITVNDIIFAGSLMIWLFVATMAGGFACSLICRSNEYTHAIILTGICLAFLLLSLIGSEGRPDLLARFISLVIACTGFLSGTKIGIMKKKRSREKRGLDL
jgi:hypothetical protein